MLVILGEVQWLATKNPTDRKKVVEFFNRRLWMFRSLTVSGQRERHQIYRFLQLNIELLRFRSSCSRPLRRNRSGPHEIDPSAQGF